MPENFNDSFRASEAARNINSYISNTTSQLFDMLNPVSGFDSAQQVKYRKEMEELAARLKRDGIEGERLLQRMRDEGEQKRAKILRESYDRQTRFLQTEQEFREKSNKEQAKYIVDREKQLNKEAQLILKNKEAAQAEQRRLEEALEKATSKEDKARIQKLLDQAVDLVADAEEANAKNTREMQDLAKLQARSTRDVQRERTRQLAEEARRKRDNGEELTSEERRAIRQERRDKAQESNEEYFRKFGDNLVNKISEGISKLAASFDSAFKEAEDMLNRYQGMLNTRLEGAGETYDSILGVLKRNLTLSPIVEQKKVLENVGKLVQSGISYNIEQRAFLATIAEDISSTFDAFDSNLLRIIRLQREDSTYARLGLERGLNNLFNKEFLDTSYLNNVYDSVSAALIDVTSQYSAGQAAEFEYNVQKWLGALYSMGASESFVSQLASGLSMLGTGNVQGLANSPMQTLFAMASNRTGTDYATLLTKGLDASNVNELLKATVGYLAEIAETSQENRVVAGAFNSIFNMSMSDMRAIRNLYGNMGNIYTSNLSYENMAGLTENRITNLASNYSLGKRVSNIWNNLLFSSAESIVSDPAAYILYQALNFVGGMGEPNIEVAPFGMGMSFKLTDLMKDAMFGVSMIANAASAIANLNNEDVGKLGQWLDAGEMRGTGYSLQARTGMSQSYSSNASSSDITESTLKSGAEKSKSTIKSMKGDEEASEEVDMYNLYYGLFNSTNDRGILTAVSENTQSLNNILASTYSIEAGAQKVVIVGWDMSRSASAFELPVKLGATGKKDFIEQAENLRTLLQAADIETLREFLSWIVASNNALNVNVASIGASYKNWVQGNAGPEDVTHPNRGGTWTNEVIANSGGAGTRTLSRW